jgi:hypothetical protein
MVDIHTRQEPVDQAFILRQQTVKQMGLLQLLIAVFYGILLTILHSLHGFLREFIQIHNHASFIKIILKSLKNSSGALSGYDKRRPGNKLPGRRNAVLPQITVLYVIEQLFACRYYITLC